MRVILGVSGGIAAYKAAELARALIRDGHEVQAILTHGAEEFIRPLTFASLTGRQVITDLFSGSSPEATLSSAVEHIGVARENDLLLVAPATANVLAKFALGLADDFLSTLYLAFRGPVVIAPAMNEDMWAHQAVHTNIETLRRRGTSSSIPTTVTWLAAHMVEAGLRSCRRFLKPLKALYGLPSGIWRAKPF